MPSFNDSTNQTKELSASSLRAAYLSTLENSPGEEMRRIYPASRLQRIAVYSRTPQGLVAICIWWIVFLLVAVFVSILPILWVTSVFGSVVNSTAVLPPVKNLGIWTNRKLYCYQPQPCGDWRPTSEVGRSTLKLEIRLEDRTWSL